MLQTSRLRPHLFLLLSSTLLASTVRSEWSVQQSDPDREGRFLTVPIIYGDWVPMGHARSTIEKVAASIENAQRQQKQLLTHQFPHLGAPPVVQPFERSDVVESGVEIDEAPPASPNDRADFGTDERHRYRLPRPGGSRALRHRQRVRGPSSPVASPYRRQDTVRRHHRKLPATSSFVNQITSFFGQPIVPPQHVQQQFNSYEGQRHRQQQQQQQQQPPVRQRPVESLPSEPVKPSFTRGQVFNVPNHNQVRFVSGPKSTTGNNRAFSVHQPQVNAIRPTVSLGIIPPAEKGPVIRLVKAPDLSTDAPPIVGPVNHPSVLDDPSSVPSPDQALPEVPLKDFSVVLSGENVPTTKEELAQLFKEDKLTQEDVNTKAYITHSEEITPEGFSKVRLPFLEHAGQTERLPNVFIAPVGFKVPEGFKGHPLPYDPSAVPTPVTVVHNVEETVDENDDSASSLIKNKIKLAQSRPSLSDFYKARKQEADESNNRYKTKKRILTKIVRRPYKKSRFTTTETVPTTTTTTTTLAPPTTSEEELLQTSSEIPSVSSTYETLFIDNSAENTFVTEKPNSVLYLDSIADDFSEEEKYDITEAAEEVTEVVETVTEKVEYFEPTTPELGTEKIEPEEVFQPIIQPTPFQAPDSSEEIIFEPTAVKTPSTTAATESTTTEFSSTTPTSVYEPTPFNLKPIRRLDSGGLRYNRFKSIDVSQDEQVVDQQTVLEVTQKPKFRKYGGFNKGETNIFGQRIRSRKRPAFWTGNYHQQKEEESQEKTSSKTEEYKKKFRPFFDQLYEKLTQKTSAKKRDPIKRYWAARSRSTTTPNPFTIDAEIYEVNPKSGQRVTESTTEESLFDLHSQAPEQPKEYDQDYHYPEEDYVADALEAEIEKEREVVKDYPDEQEFYEQEYTVPEQKEEIKVEQVIVDEPEQEPPLEYHEIRLNSEEEEIVDDVHETADKHSTLPPELRTTDSPLPPLDPNVPYTYPEAPIDYDYVHNDLVDSEDNSLDYAESQRVDSTWNDLQVLPPDGLSQVVVEKTRLAAYDKGISPSKEFIEIHDQDYTKPENVVNEHSQQIVTVEEGDFIPFQSPEEPSKPIAYVEIERPADGGEPLLKKEDYSGVSEVVVPVEVTEDVVTTEAAPETTVLPFEDEQPASGVESKVIDEVIHVAKAIKNAAEIIQEIEQEALEEEDLSVGFEAPVEEESIEEITESDFDETTLPTVDPLVTAEPIQVVDKIADETTVKVEEEESIISTTTEPFIETTTEEHRQSLLESLGISNILNYVLPNASPSTTAATTTTSPTTTSEIFDDTTTESPAFNVKEEAFTNEIEDSVEVSTEPASRSDHPKAIDTSQVYVPVNYPSDLEEKVSPKKFLKDKLGYVATKKREQLLKNWVSRKYDAKKKLSLVPTTLAPSTTTTTTTTTVTTTEAVTSTENNEALPFAPTIPPKEKSKLTKTLLDKYSLARKKKKAIQKKNYHGIPIGSKTNVFKTWDGDSLSQAEFERKVLGVSTATEVSVKSMICVRGRCYSADDMSPLIN